MAAILFNEYTFLLWWVALMAIVAQFVPVTTPVEVLGRTEQRVSLFFAVLVFFPVFRLAAFGPIINDIWAYVRSYENLSGQFSSIIDCFREFKSGFMYEAFERTLKYVFGGDRTTYRTAVALVHSIPLVVILRRYSEDYILSVFLFIAGTLHIAWMMNGLRQFVASVIIFRAFPLLLKKKYVPMILIVLLTMTIHTSAVIMLPVIFIVQGEAWNWKTLLGIAVAVVGMLLLSQNAVLFDELLVNTEYEGAIATYQAMGDDGANPIRVLVALVPVFLAFVGRRQLPKDDTVLNVCINISVLNTCIFMIASVTSGITVGSLPGYTSIYNLILYPMLIRRIFTEQSQKTITALLVIAYLAYYYYSMYM